MNLNKTPYLTLILAIAVLGLSMTILFTANLQNNVLFYIPFSVVWLILVNIGLAVSLMNFLNNISDKNPLIDFFEILLTAFTNIFLFAILYSAIGLNHGENISHNALDSLYFSLVTWTTLGYGDFSPTEYLRIPAAIEAMLGYTYMAMLIGLFLSIFNQKRKTD